MNYTVEVEYQDLYLLSYCNNNVHMNIIYVGPHLYNFLFCKLKILNCKIILILQSSGIQFVEFSQLQIKLHEFGKKYNSKNQFSKFGLTKNPNSMFSIANSNFFFANYKTSGSISLLQNEQFILQILKLQILKFAKLMNLICKI